MVIEVRPIRGEDPGTCQAIDEQGRPRVGEGVVHAMVPLADTGLRVSVVLCRQDWVEVDDSPGDREETSPVSRTLGVRSPMRDDD